MGLVSLRCFLEGVAVPVSRGSHGAPVWEARIVQIIARFIATPFVASTRGSRRGQAEMRV